MTEELRSAQAMTNPNAIFVFGSNERGVHGGGAASTAFRNYGARQGNGCGLQGRSYAIPTKRTWRAKGLPLTDIAENVAIFLAYARSRPTAIFVVTRIGCGLAGYTDTDIAPMFQDAPENCELPTGWRELRGDHEQRVAKDDALDRPDGA